MGILIVDDNATVREGLVLWLSGDPGLAIVGEAADGREAIEQAERLHPDIILMDISLPDMSGIEATRAILAGAGDDHAPRVICFSMHMDRRYPVDAFAAGAMGYVVKSRVADEIIPAIREVAAGRRFVSSSLDPALVAELSGPDQPGHSL